MKKMPLLFASVMLVAIMSAFTLTKTDPVYYRNASGIFLEKETSGLCTEHPVYACEYVWTGAEDNDPQNENNYEPVEGSELKRFIPSNP